MWDPPLTAGTLDSLHYRVIVANNDTGVVIVSNTTTVTTQPLPHHVQLCQYYTANVAAFSSEYHGDSVVIRERSPGGTCVNCACAGACTQKYVYHSFRILPYALLITNHWVCYVIHCCVFYWTRS